jgi:ribosome-associated protein
MADPIEVTPRVRILPAALEIHAIRSSGPGGQNVNKVSSKILLLVDLAGIEGLDDVSRRRLLSIAGRRITADGRLQVTAGESRDRFRNLESAREKVRQLVARSLVVPKPRRPSEPTAAARERRLRAKKRDAGVKAVRGQRPVAGEE